MDCLFVAPMRAAMRVQDSLSSDVGNGFCFGDDVALALVPPCDGIVARVRVMYSQLAHCCLRVASCLWEHASNLSPEPVPPNQIGQFGW
ncbi:MAG: hypothetical protein ACI9QQ_000203 [Myxococcota bacterium]|jgi:hypothetical protein